MNIHSAAGGEQGTCSRPGPSGKLLGKLLSWDGAGDSLSARVYCAKSHLKTAPVAVGMSPLCPQEPVLEPSTATGT